MTVFEEAPAQPAAYSFWTLAQKWARPVWTGIPLGLAVARLLYEIDPLRFGVFGTLLMSLALALAGLVIMSVLFWRANHRSLPLPTSALFPAILPWLYILTPPSRVDILRGSILIGGTILLILTLATPWFLEVEEPHRTRLRWVGILGVGLIAAIAYLLTLQRTVGRADTFEFQVTAPVLGVAHPTGYPLYLLIGKLFSLIPVGSVAARVNLASAAAATLAVIILYLTMRRALHVDRSVAIVAALAFGLSPIFWSQAVIAEVYALHNAFAAALLGGTLWMVMHLDQPPDPAAHPHGETLGRFALTVPRITIILFALVGFSLANHLTTLLLLPAGAAALLFCRPRLSVRQWTLAVGLLLLGLLIYLYLPLRWPALHEGRAMRWDEFWGWVTGSRFGGALQWRGWLDPARWQILGRLILDQYGWPGVLLSLLGLVLMIWRRWRAAVVTGLAFAAYAFYGLNYHVPDIGVFLIPLFLVLAIWMGYGVSRLVVRVMARFPERWSLWVHAILVTLFAYLPLYAAWTTGPSFDWSAEQALEAWGRRVLALPLDDNSAILADSEKIAPLEYLHRIEGLRPDMSMVVLGSEEQYLADLRSRLAAGQTVYLARFLPGLEGAYYLRSVGPLVEVGTAPLTSPPVEGDPIRWENGIALLGAQAYQQEVPAGGEAWIMLYWQSLEPVSDNVQVRTRLVDASGLPLWEGASAYPVSNRYPPVAWKDAEVVPDFYAIPILYSIRPGAYTVQVSLGPAFSSEIVTAETGGEWIDAVSFSVRPPAEQVPVLGERRAVDFGLGGLVGVEVPERVPLASPVTLVATWLNGGTGARTTHILAPPHLNAQFPILAQEGPLQLQADADTSANQITWRLTGEGLRCGWLAPLASSCTLGATQMQGEAILQAVANFDNQILLLEVSFEAGRLEPGQSLDVTLVWEGLREMDQDYTVFVHLLGPDGRVHGQVDSWPVQGTYPTSEWPVGVRIEDRYSVLLAPGAPSGSYQLEVGIYLLATNARLPILNAQGAAVDDKILLGGLLVPGQ